MGLAVALAMIAPATGRAQWSRPQSLSSPAQSVSAPFLSLARSASGIAAWTQGSGVRSKALYALRAAGTFGAPRSLGSRLTVVGTGIDNKRGLVLVAVRRVSTGYELDGFTGRLPGPLAHRQVLDRSRKPYVSTPILRTNLRGNALVVWSKPAQVGSTRRAIFMSMLRRGRFVHERRVSAGGAREFSAALGSNGRYVLAWARERVVEARYGKDVNLSGVKTVARVNTANGGPKLAAAADAIGDSAVAWEQGARDVSVVAAVRDHGGLHRPVVLSDLAEGPAAAGLQTAFRGRDALVVAWDGGDRQGPGVFAARFQGPTRATVSRVSPPDTAGSLFAELNSLATAVDNPVAVAWTQLTPPAAGGLSRRQVFASYWDGISPGFGPPEPLSAPGGDARGATLAFGWPFPFPLFAVWTQSGPGSSASTVTVSGRG